MHLINSTSALCGLQRKKDEEQVENVGARNWYCILSSLFQDYDAQDLSDFEETILQGVGYDAEGKISRKELTMILLALAKPNEDEQ